jgi:hypothetical protein
MGIDHLQESGNGRLDDLGFLVGVFVDVPGDEIIPDDVDLS